MRGRGEGRRLEVKKMEGKEKSFVKVLLKKGVTGGTGFEIECKVVDGDSKESVKALGVMAKEIAEELTKDGQ